MAQKRPRLSCQDAFTCIFIDDAQTLEQLILAGQNVDERRDNLSPLAYAIANNSVGCLKILIQHGADVNDAYQGTPLLHLALYRYRLTMAKLLIDHQVDINRTDRRGNTPLHICCLYGLPLPLIKDILDHGGDVDQRNHSGDRPIDTLAHSSKHFADILPIGKLLVDYDDTNLPNHNNRLVRALHIYLKRSAAINMLLAAQRLVPPQLNDPRMWLQAVRYYYDESR